MGGTYTLVVKHAYHASFPDALPQQGHGQAQQRHSLGEAAL